MNCSTRSIWVTCILLASFSVREVDGARSREVGRQQASAAAVKTSRTRARNRGAFAWENVRGSTLTVTALGDRVLAHSVSDETGLRHYLNAVSRFLDFVEEQAMFFTTPLEKDVAAQAYIGVLCYSDDVDPHNGDCVVSGLAYICPELKPFLSRSYKCCQSWHRMHIGGEGGPESDESLLVVIDSMRKHGDTEEADALEIAADCYLRRQDLLQMRVSDLVVAHEDGAICDVAVMLGAAERGESAKTGRRQGVRPDFPRSVQILANKKKQKQPGDKVFQISAQSYEQAWRRAEARLQAEPGCSGFHLGPLHSVRHSGPSRDAYQAYRSIWQIQRRGRWASEKSCLRYAKTHLYTSALARTPSPLLERGQQLMQARGKRAVDAKE